MKTKYYFAIAALLLVLFLIGYIYNFGIACISFSALIVLYTFVTKGQELVALYKQNKIEMSSQKQ